MVMLARINITDYTVSLLFLGKTLHLCISTTRYGLDGPGIESRWGARFSSPAQNGPGAHPVSNIVGTGSFSGVKLPGRGVDHPPPI